jgi:hypothetical protein
MPAASYSEAMDNQQAELGIVSKRGRWLPGRNVNEENNFMGSCLTERYRVFRDAAGH